MLYFLLLVWLNKTRVYNKEILANILDSKEKGKPVLTVSNHYSCFDDPGLWGMLLCLLICIKIITKMYNNQ